MLHVRAANIRCDRYCSKFLEVMVKLNKGRLKWYISWQRHQNAIRWAGIRFDKQSIKVKRMPLRACSVDLRIKGIGGDWRELNPQQVKKFTSTPSNPFDFGIKRTRHEWIHKSKFRMTDQTWGNWIRDVQIRSLIWCKHVNVIRMRNQCCKLATNASSPVFLTIQVFILFHNCCFIWLTNSS